MKRLPLLSLAFMLLIGFSVSGQVEKQEKGLDAIPPQLKARLLERLNLYIKLMRNQDYVKWYELVSDSAFNGYPRPNNEEILKFQQEMKSRGRYKLLRFRPTSTKYVEQIKAYEIRGSAKHKSVASERNYIIFAWWQNGDWYFSTLNVEMND